MRDRKRKSLNRFIVLYLNVAIADFALCTNIFFCDDHDFDLKLYLKLLFIAINIAVRH